MDQAAVVEDKGYVDPEYLRITGELLTRAKLASYDQMGIERGHRVLDVGCGPATDTIALGQLTTPTGEVFGIDRDELMIVEARQRCARAGVSAWVRHELGAAEALPSGACAFDACRSERLFQHLTDADAAMAEMVRVTRRGGRLVVLDTDWGSYSTDSAQTDLERRLARFLSERCLHNGFAGRRLPALFKLHGAVDIAIEVFPLVITDYALARLDACHDVVEAKALAAGVVSEEELQRWRQSLAAADASGAYLSTVNIFLVSGRKP